MDFGAKQSLGTQTHLFGKSAKFQLLEQGESATGAKYKASSGVQERPRCFHLRHLQEERARLAAALCVWMLLGEDYFVNLALFYILWLKVTTTERRRLPVCLANGTRRGAQRGPIKPKARREFDILTPSRQLRGILSAFFCENLVKVSAWLNRLLKNTQCVNHLAHRGAGKQSVLQIWCLMTVSVLLPGQ